MNENTERAMGFTRRLERLEMKLVALETVLHTLIESQDMGTLQRLSKGMESLVSDEAKGSS